MITVRDIETWRRKAEDEHLEFKEAKNRFDFELLVKYCCALANEGGGKISSRGRGRKYILSERLLPTISEPLDEEPPYVLQREDAEFRILGLIEVSVAKGVSKAEIVSLFPSLSDGQIKAILRDLKNKGLIEARGYKKGSRWVRLVLESKKE